jgi:23S rRNA pseudouridine2605 synthase
MAKSPRRAQRGTPLDRLLSKSGAGSRAEARRWIAEGRVAVDGRIVTDAGRVVDPASRRVALNGEPLRPAGQVYLLVHKPKGYVTTYRDPEGRKTVYDLLPGRDRYLFPAGRLDLETSGLIVMTNDSAFADALTDPSRGVPKTYVVKASKRLSDGQLAALREGMTLGDGPTRPARVTRLRDPGGRTVFEITITEGRNRQVRRMVHALGAKVLSLARVAIGPVLLADLPAGSSRPLAPGELRALVPNARRSGTPRR